MKKSNRNRTVRTALIIPPAPGGGIGQPWCPNLPIGSAYLAAVLEKSGHELTVIDCPALGIDHEKLRAKIASFEPDVVGITSVTPTIKSALKASHVSKEACPNASVILGGPHVTYMYEQILREYPEVDIVVRGEGEQTLPELVRHVANSDDLQTISGIAFRKKEQIIRTPDRPLIQNLDDLPRPAYHYFSLERYRFWGKIVLPIMTSRGCPFHCAYCVSCRMAGNQYRTRSPKNVVDELEWLKDVHKADAFTFYDDAFTYDKNRVIEICEEMKARKIAPPWDCQSRVDHISREVLAKMREANCQLIFFGIESGSQKILNAVGKGTTVEQNEKAVMLAKEVGLPVAIAVIFGYPGETMDTLQQTLDFIRRMEPDMLYICFATPFPGTELYDLVKKLGWKMSDDWSQFDQNTPVIENPSLSVDLREIRRKAYSGLFSWSYILRQSLKGTFYSRMLARTALNDQMWRMKLLRWIPRKL